MSNTICQYFKFGHCKFGVMCRHKHVQETCQDSYCEAQQCSLRHPRKCHYFQHFNRCKFNDYCSYLHDHTGAAQVEQVINLDDIKLKVNQTYTTLNEHKNEVEVMKTRIEMLENENIELKAKLESFSADVKFYIQKAVDDTANAVVEKMKTQQISLESQTNQLLNSLQRQMASLKTTITSTSSSAAAGSLDGALINEVALSPYYPSSNHCTLCGKTFKTKKSFETHMKSVHRNDEMSPTNVS